MQSSRREPRRLFGDLLSPLASGAGDAGLEVGDAADLQADVGPGGLESLAEGAVVGRQLADPLLESGVSRW